MKSIYETMAFLKKEVQKGNEQAKTVYFLLESEMPIVLKFPSLATKDDIKTYNQIVRRNVYERKLKRKLHIY